MTGPVTALSLLSVLLFQVIACLGDSRVQMVLTSPPDEHVDNQVTRKVFGHYWWEPIYRGYVFVSNRYVDAPYVLEQRGGAIYVNGLRFDYIPEDRQTYDIAQTLASPPPPASLPSNATVQDIVTNDTVRAHAKHMVATSSTDDEAVLRFCDYLRKLPAVTNVLDSGMDSAIGQRDILVTDLSGNTGTFVLSYVFSDVCLSVKQSTISGHLEPLLEILRTDGCAVSQRGCMAIGWYGSRAEATNLLLTMTADDLTPTQRLSRMEELGFVDRPSDMTAFGIRYPLHGATVTDQFRQRFRGDTTWTNDAPGRLLRLTNGWVRVKPYATPVHELAKRLHESRAKKELQEEEQRAAQFMAQQMALAEEKRRQLIKRTGRTIQDSLSVALAEATNAPREYILPDICHWTLNQTNHIYSIGDCASSGYLAYLTPEWARPGQPGSIQEIEFAATNLSLLVRTSGILTNLQDFVGSLASLGFVPHWTELETRRRRSAAFNSNLFVNVPVRTAATYDWSSFWPVAWSNEHGPIAVTCGHTFGISNGVGIVTLRLAGASNEVTVSVLDEGRTISWDDYMRMSQRHVDSAITMRGNVFRINATAERAMSCGREQYIVVRVFDSDGKYVWQSPARIGWGMVCHGDVTGDGLDDIVVFARDHGTVSYHVFKQQPGQ